MINGLSAMRRGAGLGIGVPGGAPDQVGTGAGQILAELQSCAFALESVKAEFANFQARHQDQVNSLQVRLALLTERYAAATSPGPALNGVKSEALASAQAAANAVGLARSCAAAANNMGANPALVNGRNSVGNPLVNGAAAGYGGLPVSAPPPASSPVPTGGVGYGHPGEGGVNGTAGLGTDNAAVVSAAGGAPPAPPAGGGPGLPRRTVSGTTSGAGPSRLGLGSTLVSEVGGGAEASSAPQAVAQSGAVAVGPRGPLGGRPPFGDSNTVHGGDLAAQLMLSGGRGSGLGLTMDAPRTMLPAAPPRPAPAGAAPAGEGAEGRGGSGEGPGGAGRNGAGMTPRPAGGSARHHTYHGGDGAQRLIAQRAPYPAPAAGKAAGACMVGPSAPGLLFGENSESGDLHAWSSTFDMEDGVDGMADDDDDDGEDSRGGTQYARGKAITYEDLQEHFKYGLKTAALKLGVCPTTLKRACRRHGIKRWPARQVAKLSKYLDKMGYQGETHKNALKETVANHFKQGRDDRSLLDDISSRLGDNKGTTALVAELQANGVRDLSVPPDADASGRNGNGMPDGPPTLEDLAASVSLPAAVTRPATSDALLLPNLDASMHGRQSMDALPMERTIERASSMVVSGNNLQPNVLSLPRAVSNIDRRITASSPPLPPASMCASTNVGRADLGRRALTSSATAGASAALQPMQPIGDLQPLANDDGWADTMLDSFILDDGP